MRRISSILRRMSGRSIRSRIVRRYIEVIVFVDVMEISGTLAYVYKQNVS